MNGSYILLIRLAEGKTIHFGRHRQTYFRRGYYAYVGSAMRGLEARVNRHLSKGKKLHWHIDYLMDKASLTGVILAESDCRTECAIAQALHSHFDSIPGFGSSDCHCPSHLFFSTNKKELEQRAMGVLKSLGLKPQS